ncbi:hypothetical protein GQ44DRAFT_627274 [Phaeosphaeriaceae sp. PMI808]|nr:hypothetical protein GQ44DRAFT_627274 [Phaeosphaeriaceae sp. PMI808]
MTHNLLRSGGIGALACVATNNASLLSCTLQVKYDEGSSHATFSLQHATHIHGFAEAQFFNFIYDADNLLPATTTCKTATRTLTRTELAHIARTQISEVQALSLNLKKPCAILCPNVPGSIAPKASHEVPFRHLVDLAKATEITILFDWKWLHQRRHSPFLNIVSQPETFSGFPINEKNLKGHRLEDWSVFSPTEDYVSNEPPPYTEASHKRHRQISSSPPQSPPAKRVFYIPEGSLTEKATTTLTPSPRQPSSTVDESPRLRFPRAESPHFHPHLEDANTAYDAQCLRSTADEDFLSAVEEQKLDMQSRKDDALEELQDDIEKMVDEKLRELDVTVAEYMEEAGEQVESAINQKLDRFLNRKWVAGVARCAAEASGGKMGGGETRRAGHAAGDRKRYRFSRCVR